MKIIAAIFVGLILLVGCTMGPGPSVHTQTVTVSPEPSNQARTETPTAALEDSYPPAITPPLILTAAAQPYPPPGENQYTFGSTPTPLSPLQEAQRAWDSCKNADAPPEIASFQNIKLAGLVFRYANSKWRIGADGRAGMETCLTSTLTSTGGGWEVFWWNDAIWAVDRDAGVVHTIVSSQERFSSSPVWSPDEKYVYYAESNTKYEDADIWVWDVETGKSHPLTNTPDVHEAPVSVWPAYPNWLLFISRPRDLLNKPDTIGYLSMMRTDGSGEQRLTESPVPSFDLSPDGNTLAYQDDSKAWLLRPGNSPKPFLPEQFSIENWNIKSLSRPGWSPDGTKIAWFALGENSTGKYSGAAVFDLVKNEAWFVHPFVYAGTGRSPFFLVWDPSSLWFAVGISDENLSNQGIWFVRYDGSEEHQNGFPTYGITWSPAGDQFLYKNATSKKIYLKQVGVWTAEETNLPYDSVPIIWEEINAP